MAHLSLQWFVIALDVSVKALVLALIAAFILQLPKLRDSNIRHRAWTGVLLGMLLLPILSQVIPDLRLPFTIPASWLMAGSATDALPIDNSAKTSSAGPLFEPTSLEDAMADATDGSMPFDPSALNDEFGPRFLDGQPGNGFGPVASQGFDSEFDPAELNGLSDPASLEIETLSEPDATSAAKVPLWKSVLSRWPAILLCAWAAGVLVLGLRLLVALLCSVRLVRCSTPISTTDLLDLGVEARFISEMRADLPILECPLIRVPLMLGCWNPRVLLPPEWLTWPAAKLQAVIAHERTHVERADHTVILLAEINRCLYWFHPLSWWLRHRLATLAEEACDDAAIDCTGDRTAYAQHLLEVAGTLTGERGRVMHTGLSMARQSNVETRINAILDFTRPLSRRLTWVTTLLLLGTIIPLIAVAAALRPSTEEELRRLEEAVVVTTEPADEIIDLAADSADATTETATNATASDDSKANVEFATVPVSHSYSGHVTDADGNPISDAQIFLIIDRYSDEEPNSLHELGQTDRAGDFSIDLAPPIWDELDRKKPGGWPKLVARASGYGLDWLPLEVFEDHPAPSQARAEQERNVDQSMGAGRFAGRTLKLPSEERPIRGRLVDLEGRPLRQIDVVVEEMSRPDPDLLIQAFEHSSKDMVFKAINSRWFAGGGLSREPLQRLIPSAMTDVDGSFTLAGIGHDQLASLSIQGEGVESRQIYVLGRTMEPVQLPHVPFYPKGSKDVYFGRDFSYAVGPSVPVSGVVKDFDTGAPIQGTIVYVERLFKEGGRADGQSLRVGTQRMRSVTDANGRFRITGIPPGVGHVLEAVPPKSEPYLMASQDVSPSLEDSETTVEIRVKKFFWIEGRVTDRATGAPINGWVDYLALRKNPHTLDKLGLRQAWEIARYRTDDDGYYRVPGIPGPGVLLVHSLGGEGYPLEVGAETVEGYDADSRYIPTTPTGLPLSNWNLIKQIDPPVGTESFVCDLVLNAGQSIPGRAIGPDGNPISELDVLGEIINSPYWKERANGQFALEGYDGKGPRQLFLKNRDGSLVGQFRLEGKAPAEIVVTLQAAIRVAGRLIENETNEPAERYELSCDQSSLGDFRIDDVQTDDEGQFQIKGLMAGTVYDMNASNERRFSSNRNRFRIDLTNAKPGDVIELGDVTGKQRRAAMGASETSLPTAEMENPGGSEVEQLTFRGTVLTPDGKPLAGATVHAIRARSADGGMGRYTVMHKPLTQVSTNSEGEFRIQIPKDATASAAFSGMSIWRPVDIIATAPGFAPTWVSTRKLDPEQELTLELAPDSVAVEGRMLDIEGRPLPGITVGLRELAITKPGVVDQWLEDVKGLHEKGALPIKKRIYPAERTSEMEKARLSGFGVLSGGSPVLPSQAITDDQGRFRFEGLGPDRRVEFELSGPGIVKSSICVVTRPMETVSAHRDESPGFRNHTYYGARFDHVAEPSVPVTGIVVDADSGDPLPGVTVAYGGGWSIYDLRRAFISGTTDGQGRFRLEGLPKQKGNEIDVFPADGQPYLILRSINVPEGSGLESPNIEIKLRRGVFVRGKLTDSQTGAPVDATLHYNPYRSNAHAKDYSSYTPNSNRANFEGTRYRTAPDGSFEIVAIPGRGILSAEVSYAAGYCRGIGADEIGGLDRHGTFPTYNRCSIFSNALREIDIPADAKEVHFDLQVVPGRTLVIRAVDPDGEPLTGVRFGAASTLEGLESEYTILGLRDGDTRRVMIYHEPRQLGQVLEVKVNPQLPEVQTAVLEPCGTVTGRLVSRDGEPITHQQVQVHLEPSPRFGQLIAPCETDDTGTFRHQGMLPNTRYSLFTIFPGRNFSIAKDLKIEPGQTIDLGEFNVDAKPEMAEKSATRANRAETKETQTENAVGTPDDPASHSDIELRYEGRVVSPDGDPVAGAKIHFVYWVEGASPDASIKPLAMSDADGKFEFTQKKVPDAGWQEASLVATADGHGFACGNSSLFETTGAFERDSRTGDRLRQLKEQASNHDRVLRLSRDDVPITGRIVDIEGQPVRRARVRVIKVRFNEQENLDAWEQAALAEKADYYSLKTETPLVVSGPQWPAASRDVITDNQGRFTLRGIGRERVAELLISGPGIETKEVKTRTRAGRMIDIPFAWDAQHVKNYRNVYYGSDFTHAAGPSKPLVGRITDAETGMPIAGVHLRAVGRLMTQTITKSVLITESVFSNTSQFIEARSGPDGRYRLEGLPVGGAYDITVHYSGELPYVSVRMPVKTEVGTPEITQDIQLRKGVLIHGNATDDSGKPVSGRVRYQVLPSNPHLQTYSSPYQIDTIDDRKTDDQGRFEIPVLPGPGVLKFQSLDYTGYRLGVGAEEVSSQIFTGSSFHALQRIDPPVNSEPIEVKFAVIPLRAVTARLVDQNGEPLTGGIVSGIVQPSSWSPVLGNTFTIEGYDPQKPSDLFAYHEEQGLAGHIRLEGDPPRKVTIKLAPTGSVRGRLVDKFGDPLPGLFLSGEGVPARNFGKAESRLATKQDGRFLIRGLIPGRKYTVLGNRDQTRGRVLTDVTVDAGQTKDVGEVTLQSPDPRMIFPSPSAAGAAAAPSTEAGKSKGEADVRSAKRHSVEGKPRAITVSGIVLKPDGTPAAGATVRAAAPETWIDDVDVNVQPPMSQVEANEEGRFTIDFTTAPYGEPSRLEQWQQELWKRTHVVASLQNFGPAWASYADIEHGEPLTLRLVEDTPIRGRVIDLEGRPIAGTTVEVGNPGALKNGELDAWLESIKNGEPSGIADYKAGMRIPSRLTGTPTDVVTSNDGSFEIHGIGKDRTVQLTFEGETVAHRDVNVVTRRMEPLQRLITTGSTERVFGADFTFTAEPARVIEGVVKDAETGEPLVGVAVKSHKRANYPMGNHRVTTLITDQAGRFRMLGMPKGIGNRLLLVPTDDQPYFMREIEVPDTAGLGPVEMEIELHRGIWITGRVADKDTGAPLDGVRMYYLPFRANLAAQRLPEFGVDGRMDGNQLRYQTRSDGTYRLVGLPGPAVLGAECVKQDYPMGIGYEEIEAPQIGTSGWIDTYRNPGNPTPNWPTMMKQINPPTDIESLQVDFNIKQGPAVQLRLVDTEGNPVSGVSIDGLGARSHVPALAGAVQTAINFGPDETRTIIIRHDERRIGQVIRVTPEDVAKGELTVTLEPFATVTARLLNDNDAPMTGVALGIDTLPSDEFSKYLSPRVTKAGSLSSRVTTDAEGRFTESLIPGCNYNISGEGAGIRFFMIAGDLHIKPGEKKDLGTLRFDKNGGRIRQVDRQRNGLTGKPLANSAATPDNSRASTMKSETHGTSDQEENASKVDEDTGTKPAEPALGEMSPMTVTVTGVVLKPDGTAAVGATLRAGLRHWATEMESLRGKGYEPPISTTVADQHGRFSIRFTTEPYGDLSRFGPPWHELWKRTELAASLKGFGPAWVMYDDVEAAESLTLTLGEDMPIHGRVLDLEGRPVAGTTLMLDGPRRFTEANLRSSMEIANLRDLLPKLAGTPQGVITDRDGRFEINGFGKDRLVRLTLGDESISYQKVDILTRNMEPLQLSPPTRRRGSESRGSIHTVYGADFTFTAEPARVIEGIIKDAHTETPLSGATIESDRFANIPLWHNRAIKAVSDENGKFRLLGMPKGPGNAVVVSPADDQPYFMRRIEIPEPSGLEPVKLDIGLHRGIWITGKVTDKKTGAPVPAVWMHYLPYRSNEFAKGTPGFHQDGTVDGDEARYQTRSDGTYRLVGLPGPAIVGAAAKLWDYPVGAGYEETQGPRNQKSGYLETYYNPAPAGPKWPTMMKEINPAPDAESVGVDFEFDSGSALRISIVDVEGHAVHGATVDGMGARAYMPATNDPVQTAINFGPAETRTIVIRHDQRRIGKVVRVTPDDVLRGEITVTLEPFATITGRLLKEDAPMTGIALRIDVLPFGDFGKQVSSDTATDELGRFAATLIPGCEYDIYGAGLGSMIASKLSIQPGETKDLGTLHFGKNGKRIRQGASLRAEASGESKLSQQERRAQEIQPADESATASNQRADRTLISGRVLDPDGEPVANSEVVAIEHSKQRRAGGDLSDEGVQVFKTQPISAKTKPEQVTVSGNVLKPNGNHAAGAMVRAQTPLWDDSPVANRGVSTQPLSYSGRVETPQGEPIAGAKIWLAVTSHEYNNETNRENREGILRELGTADEQGRFEVVLDAVTTQEIRKRLHFAQTQLVATAEGRGLDWMPLDVFEDNPTPSEKRDTMQARIDQSLGVGTFARRALKLRPESQPVRGRLVDLEGHPLPNVTVLVESLKQPDIPRLLKAFEMSWKREVNEAFSATMVGVGGLAKSELQKLIPLVTTDENGEFELHGIGDNQLVTLVFDADRVEARPLYVLGREMETVSLPHIDSYRGGAKDVFVGRDFNYAIGPSVPVEGVVTEYDTGEPVANVLVYVERLFKKEGVEHVQLRLDTHHMWAVTDRQGRFRITGMPPGEGHVLEAIPRKSEPYLPVSQDVSLSLKDGGAKRIEIQVKRGIWIEGRVTDKQSGEPLFATVDYMPLKKNPHALDKLGLDWVWVEQRYGTDSDGHYRTLGLPGAGVLLVKSQVPGYPLAAGAETIDGYDASGGVIPTKFFPLPVSDWHLLKQIDPVADAISFPCDLVLDAGVSIPGRVVGPDGKPISEFYVLGQTEGDKWWGPRNADNTRTTTDRFAVNGYDGKGPRQLFFKNQDETLVGQYRLEGHAPEEIVVTLQPSVRVTGRVIAKETDLPAARYFLNCERCSLNNPKYPPVNFMIHWCHTDDEGRFEIKGLMAGLAYKMIARNDSVSNNPNRNRFTIDLTDANPGDVIEIGDVTPPDSEGDFKN